MKTYIPYVLAACMLLLLPAALRAQYNRYNININNGLPSNHVYYLLKDKEGYLWISTDKGVARYNGYDFKLFDHSAGISHDDIWHLYEDRKQRLWLSDISNEMGYIRNGQYHKAVIKSREQSLYPIYISENEDGIFFLSISAHVCLCTEKNDTITCRPITIPNDGVYLHKDGALIILKDSGCYRLTTRNNRLSYEKNCYRPQHIPCYLYNNCIVPFPYKADSTHLYKITDISGCRQWTTPLEPNENIYMLNEYNGFCYLTSNKNTYRLSSRTGIRKILSFDEIQAHGLKENDILTVIEDNLWGQCIATNTNGLYINYHEGRFRTMKDETLAGCRYAGSADSCHYWWNKSKRTLVRYDQKGILHVQKYPDILDVLKIIPCAGYGAVVLTNNNIFRISGDRLTDFYTGIRTVTEISKTAVTAPGGKIRRFASSSYRRAFTDCVAGEPGELFLLQAGGGCAFFRLCGDSLATVFIDEKRYWQVAYDRMRKVYWACGNDAISILNSKAEYIIDKKTLQLMGIRDAEKILVDETYGNLFLKCDDRLLTFDIQNRSCKELYKNYNLNGSVQLIYNNRLIVAGKPGVLFSRISGLNNIAGPVLYQNIKNTAYDYINDVQASGDSLVLHTDKGLLAATIPPDSYSVSAGLPPYRLLIRYHDSSYTAAHNGIINLDPHDPVLQPDVINPSGNGTLHYKYLVNETDIAWHSLGEDRLYLQGLVPGHLYTLSVMAYDDAWKSNPVKFIIRIIPRWWQTNSGRNILWLTGFLLTGLLIFIVIQATRIIVTRRHIKENMQLELNNLNLALELKSIYAQINPHFIFNTLSTALYFIKKRKFDEAHTHVSAFSDLLRSYIKSSRNKFISLAEEIENLEHYILLQQARFEHKFVYRIHVDDRTETEATEIPSLLLQPLVENAINHGLLHKENGLGHLDILFKKDEQRSTLVCTIEDDGIGRKKAREYRAQTAVKTPSYGDDLIRELINIFNRAGQINIDIQYTDKTAPQTGTIVTITIQYLSHGN